MIVFALLGTAFTATDLERIDAAFIKFDHAKAVYDDLDIAGANNSVWPLAFPAFDYERLLEQGAPATGVGQMQWGKSFAVSADLCGSCRWSGQHCGGGGCTGV